jgi:hypothetical protein
MTEAGDLVKEFPQSKFVEFRPTPRSGVWKIEVPNQLVTFEEILRTSLPVALEEVDGRVRNLNTTLHFVPNLVHKEGQGKGVFSARGISSFKIRSKSSDIVIGLTEEILRSPLRSSILSQVVLHELFEIDYHVKTMALGRRMQQTPLSDAQYSNSEHEVIATNKAILCLQKSIGMEVENPEAFQEPNYWEKVIAKTPAKYADE